MSEMNRREILKLAGTGFTLNVLGQTPAINEAFAAKKGTRNPLKWPYDAESFWNMPISTTADLVPLNMPNIASNQYNFRWEEEIMTLDPDAPVKTIMAHNAGWNGNLTRCGSRTGGPLVGNNTVSDVTIPVPTGFFTDPAGPPGGYLGTTPNHGSAHVKWNATHNDIILLETQPTHFCTDGVVVSQYINSDWVGESITQDGHGVKDGSHGGSYMTAFGGTIRCHEWVPEGRIPHAIKIVLNTARVCYAHDTYAECYTWPALEADSAAVGVYGSSTTTAIPQEAKMGMLLTLPNGYNWAGLRTAPARILARAIYEFGAYLVDGDAGLDVFMVATEWSNEGRVLNNFNTGTGQPGEVGWGIKGFHRPAVDGTAGTLQANFWLDMKDIYMNFRIVRDNAPANPGGIGAVRRAEKAPALMNVANL